MNDALPIAPKSFALFTNASNGKRYLNKEFTIYVPAKEFLRSLKTGLNWPYEATRADDNREQLFQAKKSFDFDGMIAIDGANRIGRVHAARCFKGEYFSVTVRCERKGDGKDANQATRSLRRAKASKSMEWRETDIFPIQVDDLARNYMYEIVYEQINPQKKIAADAAGLLLVSGATSSGKTTCLKVLMTLHMQQRLNKLHGDLRVESKPERYRRPHVVVIGDPVETSFYERCLGEYSNAGAYQSGHQESLHVDFTSRSLGIDVDSVAQGLRDALRETPSFVVVSELRDEEDFRAALDFAATGHLIFATSHNTSLVDTFSKLLQVSNADTPGKRATLIQRLFGAVHLRSIGEERIPTIWRSTPGAVTGFVAEGLSSLIAGGALKTDQADTHRGVLGRYWMANHLKEKAIGGKKVKDAIKAEALKLDLGGY